MSPCPKCTAEVPENETYCPRCFEPVEPRKRLGWWRRFWNALVGPPATLQVGSARVCTHVQHLEFVDPMTGQRKQADSLDQVPAELRPQLEEVYRQAFEGRGRGTFVFRDFAGTEHTYQSLADMPPEIRSLYEQVCKMAGLGCQSSAILKP